jgi:hypothetical protein
MIKKTPKHSRATHSKVELISQTCNSWNPRHDLTKKHKSKLI